MVKTKRVSAIVPVLLWLVGGCAASGTGLLSSTDSDSATQAATATSAASGPACQIPEDAAATTDHILRMINIERLDLGAVVVDPKLSAIAGDYACTMIHDGFFGHTHPVTHEDISKRLDNAGYSYKAVGENLAAGYWNAHEITDAWMASETHKEIMLDPSFTRAGVAVRYGGDFGVYCVLVLAEPAE